MFACYARWIRNFSAKLKPLTAERFTFPVRNDAVKLSKIFVQDSHAALACINDWTVYRWVRHVRFCCRSDSQQVERPVAFMSTSLSRTECKYLTEEATSIVEAVRKWSHYLYARPFTLITDQQSLAYMFDQTQRGKMKCENSSMASGIRNVFVSCC